MRRQVLPEDTKHHQSGPTIPYPEKKKERNYKETSHLCVSREFNICRVWFHYSGTFTIFKSPGQTVHLQSIKFGSAVSGLRVKFLRQLLCLIGVLKKRKSWREVVSKNLYEIPRFRSEGLTLCLKLHLISWSHDLQISHSNYYVTFSFHQRVCVLLSRSNF